MNCKFATISENIHQCSICGFTIKVKQDPERIINTCNTETLTLIEKGINFVNAMTEWVSAGVPITPKDIKSERQKICEACPEYDNGTCKRCGCNMNLKILMETSSCPIGRW